MSHRYGERLPTRSQGLAKRSPQCASSVYSHGQAEDAPTAQVKSGKSAINTTDGSTESQNSHKEAFKGSPANPSLDDMNSWTLTQLRAHLQDVVIDKQKATGQARVGLETRRISLIERITKMERAELMKKDTAKRVIIGRDVVPPPPDAVEKPWRRKWFGPNTRRSGPEDVRRRVKEGAKEEKDPEEELHSKRWKLKRKRPIEEEYGEEEGGEGGEGEAEAMDEVAEEDTGLGTEQQEDMQEHKAEANDDDETKEQIEAKHGMRN